MAKSVKSVLRPTKTAGRETAERIFRLARNPALQLCTGCSWALSNAPSLEQRAKGLGKTVSELVREILEEAVADRPLGQRTAHVKGRLELPASTDSWQRQLKERNWRD